MLTTLFFRCWPNFRAGSFTSSNWHRSNRQYFTVNLFCAWMFSHSIMVLSTVGEIFVFFLLLSNCCYSPSQWMWLCVFFRDVLFWFAFVNGKYVFRVGYLCVSFSAIFAFPFSCVLFRLYDGAYLRYLWHRMESQNEHPHAFAVLCQIRRNIKQFIRCWIITQSHMVRFSVCRLPGNPHILLSFLTPPLHLHHSANRPHFSRLRVKQ